MHPVGTAAFLALALMSCKSAHERGKDLAEEKLGFAEGVADGVKEKGATVGRKGVEGVSEVIKGIGSAVKDQAAPSVSIKVPGELEGVTVRDAHALLASSDRAVMITVSFSKKVEGAFQLIALDEQGKEGLRSVPFSHETRLAGTEANLRFVFPPEAHLSGVKTFMLVVTATKSITAATDLLGATATQLRESPPIVSVYMTYPKKLGVALQLRAYDASGAEVARSEPSDIVATTDDSAGILKFTFPGETPFGAIAKYELRRAPSTEKGSNVKGLAR